MTVETVKEPKIIIAEDGKTYTFDEVATYVKYHAPDATPEEIEEFFNYCRIRSLSPYDVHFIKWGKNQKPTIVVGKDAFLKRAERSKQLNGYDAGVIVLNKETGEVVYRRGAFYIKGKEELVGGWAEVYRKDYEKPIRAEVSLEEYARKTKDGKLMNNWAQMPATMIRKVALVQALREAFPSEMSGMYVPEEMGIEVDEETGEVISHGGLDSDSNGDGTSSNPSATSNNSSKPITDPQRKKIFIEARRVYGKDNWREPLKAFMESRYGKTSTRELTREEASDLIESLESLSDYRPEKAEESKPNDILF